jgi:hypothetical protein
MIKITNSILVVLDLVSIGLTFDVCCIFWTLLQIIYEAQPNSQRKVTCCLIQFIQSWALH